MAMQKLWDLAQRPRPEGWRSPASVTVDHARTWLIQYLLSNVATAGTPHMSISAHGEIVFTWWHGSHKLNIYFDEEGVEYLKTWGADVYTQMEDGPAIDIDPLFAWLWGDGANAA